MTQAGPGQPHGDLYEPKPQAPGPEEDVGTREEGLVLGYLGDLEAQRGAQGEE